MTNDDLQAALFDWLRSGRYNSNENPPGAPPVRCKIQEALIEQHRETNTFDVRLEDRVVTRICPNLQKDFPFIFDKMKVGGHTGKFGHMFDLTSIHKFSNLFQKMLNDPEDDTVGFAYMTRGNFKWILKCWKLHDEHMRIMYIKQQGPGYIFRWHSDSAEINII